MGIVAGVPLALAGARLIEHQLFGVAARNPSMMAGAAVLLLASAVAAALIPAARVAAQDPVRALNRG
jgi:ABC-type lipoprotein release transport system permease subunit